VEGVSGGSGMGAALCGGSTCDGDSDFFGFVQVFVGETIDGFIWYDFVGCGCVTHGCGWGVFSGFHGLGWVM